MNIDNIKIGEFIALKRKEIGLTQNELSERLNITPQSVSNWERGESLPDTSLLPDLSLILNTTIDELLGGGTSEWLYKRRISVDKISRVIDSIEYIRNILGEDHFMYKTMIEALDKRMNSSIELIFSNSNYKDAYICEAILECANNGAYIDIDDIKKNIKNEKTKTYTISKLNQLGNK